MECSRTDLIRDYMGCWKDYNFTAISGGIRLTKPKPHLDILDVCFNKTLDLGYQIFGVTRQHHPYQEVCVSAQDAGETYAQYGVSRDCKFGKGGVQALSVYSISCPGQSLLDKFLKLFLYTQRKFAKESVAQKLSLTIQSSNTLFLLQAKYFVWTAYVNMRRM